MNKKILISIIIVGVLFLMLATSWILWLVKPGKNLDVYILDKTVPTKERTEHKGMHWVLTHEKYHTNEGNAYDLNKDYYGFFPLSSKSKEFDFRSVRIHEIDEVAYDYDMLYYADTYGVYYNEWYKRGSSDIKHTQKVYGGLNQNDYLLMKRMKELNKLIITEFNLYDAPTNGLIREKVESMFGLKWTGWTGKYYSSLDTSNGSKFPKWITILYKEQNNNQWPFKNAGIVLVHKFGTVVVLEQGAQLNKEIPYIISKQETIDRFNVPEEVYYSQWFDITYSTEQNNILANFKIHVNENGDSILRNYNLKPVFPAVIEHTGDYNFYYFGGDFAESTVCSKTAFFEGYHNMVSVLNRSNFNSNSKFYWSYYVPMLTKILDDYYNTLD